MPIIAARRRWRRTRSRAGCGKSPVRSKRSWTTSVCALALLGAGCAVAAESYPARPVRLIVPFAPGGGADFMGRLVAQNLNEQHGYTVVVDNRGGAGGAIGGSIVSAASPDGYTLVLANNTTHVMIVATQKKPPYDPVKDFTAISMVTYAPQLLVASVKVPVKTTQELIAYAKARPGVL